MMSSITEGCHQGCNSHGECVQRDGDWGCECFANWTGTDCGIPFEDYCSECFASPDPVDILLRKQPLSPTSSFFQRMQFLIEEDSVQSYAHKQAFNDR